MRKDEFMNKVEMVCSVAILVKQEEEEFVSHALYEDKSGDPIMIPMEASTQEGKEEFALMLRGYLKKKKADNLIMVADVYYTRFKKNEDRAMIRPSQDPSRKEAINIYYECITDDHGLIQGSIVMDYKDNGGIISFKEKRLIDAKSVSGYMANFLTKGD